jgi:hypothetical protein
MKIVHISIPPTDRKAAAEELGKRLMEKWREADKQKQLNKKVKAKKP